MDTIFFPGARNNFSIYRNKNNEINFFYRFTKDEFTGSKSYYDDSSRKFFINYSVADSTFFSIIGFEKGSMYLNNKEFYEYVYPIYSMDHAKGIINVLYPYKKKLYQYNLSNFILKNIIELNPEHFNSIYGTPFGLQPDFNRTMKLIQENSFYLNIYSFNDTILMVYREGKATDGKTKSIQQLDEEASDFNYYLEYYYQEKKFTMI